VNSYQRTYRVLANGSSPADDETRAADGFDREIREYLEQIKPV
jgi:hypothetical protein